MKRSLIALGVVNLVDAISYMVVAPSLIFYVIENGGCKEQYGMILSAFSFASFCAKPLLGWWSDVHGFRIPYMTSLSVAAAGGIVYLFSSALPSGPLAISAMAVSRLLGGVGVGSSALGFAYVSRVFPHSEQTSTNASLSTMTLFGMAIGPGVNALIAWIRVDICGGAWRLDPLNSVGLVLLLTNLCAVLAVAFLLEEPIRTNKTHQQLLNDATTDDYYGSVTEKGIPTSHAKLGIDHPKPSKHLTDVLSAILSADILVPLLSIFTFNAGFQLIETGFPPSTKNALGWGTVQTSVALGFMAVVIMCNLRLVSILSSKLKIPDRALLCFGHILSAASYSAIYFSWRSGAKAWNFWVPILFAAGSFPFVAGPTRSIYSVSVDTKPILEEYHGRMQALLSMGTSVAGFVTPAFVARHCLRTPSDVDASIDGRELTPFSLFPPLLSFLTLIGISRVRMPRSKIRRPTGVENGECSSNFNSQFEEPLSEEDEQALLETAAILMRNRRKYGTIRRSTLAEKKYDPEIAVHRNSSCSCMGITLSSAEGE